MFFSTLYPCSSRNKGIHSTFSKINIWRLPASIEKLLLPKFTVENKFDALNIEPFFSCSDEENTNGSSLKKITLCVSGACAKNFVLNFIKLWGSTKGKSFKKLKISSENSISTKAISVIHGVISSNKWIEKLDLSNSISCSSVWPACECFCELKKPMIIDFDICHNSFPIGLLESSNRKLMAFVMILLNIVV